jgi:Nif-specific regulatory protein
MSAEASSRLETLIEINRQLMGKLAPDGLLELILESAMRLFSAEGCSIALLDDGEKELAFTTIAGSIEAREFRLEMGQGIAGWVAQTGESVICNDVAGDPRWYAGVDRRTGFETRSILCAPLRLHDRLIGAIEVLNTAEAHGFGQSDLELLAAFAGLAATAIDRSRAVHRISNANLALREEAEDRYALVAGESPAMREVVEMLRAAAAGRSTVLLMGESGVGKEVLARAVHRWSPRAEAPFVAVNCLALTPELLESELFGHEKGAFTGAVAQKKGKFELANAGTIFLDEIGDLAPNLQAKLLRVLQEREFQRVGGVRDIRADVRVVAATNRDLQRALAEGSFREDLYYRLNVVSVTVPPLRVRKVDIPAFVERFTDRYAREMNRSQIRVGPAAMELLVAYDWPGNVRELQNAIERAVVLSSGDTLEDRDLPAELRAVRAGRPAAGSGDEAIEEALPLAQAVDAFKLRRIRSALDAAQGNQTEAAKLLGMRQSNLSRLMKTLGMK